MFGIDFSELVIIAVVALVVLGPERLPRVARMLGHLVGRTQRYVANLKAEIDKEIKMEELKKLQDEFRDAEASARHVIQEETHTLEAHVQQVEAAVGDAPKTAAPAEPDASASPPRSE
jgi:sec-independent protein translocase protein TatB